MKAFQLIEHGSPGKFELRDVPDPSPGSEEVLVNVRACGLNRLDLWCEAGDLPVPVPLPLTPGCEAAGEIESVGSNVSAWKPGDRVALQSNLFCGHCEFCDQDEESICLNSKLLGVQVNGGFAEKVVVPSRTLVPLPDNVPYQDAAALTLAASTAMHMLTARTTVKPNDWVLVMGGSSGVGSAAIQIAKELGARVISTGSTETKRALAIDLGAQHVIDLNDKSWTREVRRITEKRGVNVVVEHIGGEILQNVFQCLARNGTVVTCGATAGKTVPLDLWPFFVKQQRLIGSYGRNRSDMIATLEWASKGKLKAVIDAEYPLEKATEAYDHLRERKTHGKCVIRLDPAPQPA